MNSHMNRNTVFLDGKLQNLLKATALTTMIALMPFASQADNPDSKHNHATGLGHASKLGHATGSELEVKRLNQTGKGMPSIKGPFPDTFNMTLLGQLTNAELGVTRLTNTGAAFLSDIWGWTAPAIGEENPHEYAIVGTSSGVAFVRITDPSNPEFLGIVPTTDTSTIRNFWWDIKTYNNRAYWITEVNNAGVASFDLTLLKDMGQVTAGTAISQGVKRYHGNGYLRAHNISINEATGFAYLTGASKNDPADPAFTDNGVIILDLKGEEPVEVAQINDIDSHDAQVVIYHGPDLNYVGKEIAIIFNGSDLEVGIYDVTDKTDIVELSVTNYAGASYAHQGWLTEDHGYMLMGDEEDELFGISDPKNPDLPDTARTYIWDLTDLKNPFVNGTFDSDAAAIDHNLFVKGNRIYQANYTSGIRVLEFVDISKGKLKEVAHMDTCRTII